MPKADQIADLKAKYGVDVPEELSVKQLTALQETADKAAFGALLANLTDGDSSNDPEGTKEDTVSDEGNIRVRVRQDAEVAENSGYLHPQTKALIRWDDQKGVSVPNDAWTQEHIEKRVLAEVR